MEDDTVEIENDMQTLLKSVDNPSIAPEGIKDTHHRAGSTPFSEDKREERPVPPAAMPVQEESPDESPQSSQESDMSMDTTTDNFPKFSAEDTFDHMDNLPRFQARPLGSHDETMDEETVELEVGMSELLAQAQHEPEHVNGEENDATTEKETAELEGGMAELLAQTQQPESSTQSPEDLEVEANDSHEATIEKETAELEKDMADLLAQTQRPEALAHTQSEDSTLGAKRKLEGADVQPEGEETVELELDMQNLLDATGCKSRLSEMSIDSGVSAIDSTSSKRRRSSVSSRRFSIDPRRRTSVSLDTTYDIESPATKQNIEEKDSQSVESDADEMVSLQVEEVLELLNKERKESSPQDVIGTFHSQFLRCDSKGVFEGLEAFLEQVCAQLEEEKQNSTEIESDFFTTIPKEEYQSVLRLQRFIRSNDTLRTEEAVNNVASSIEKSERKEWDAWLVQAARGLLQHATSVCNSLTAQRSEVTKYLQSIESHERHVFNLKSKRVHQMRRKKLNGRKENAQALKNDVDEMEKAIDAARKKLAAGKARKEGFKAAESQDERKRQLKSTMPKIREQAEASERKWITIKKASAWQLSEIHPSQTSFSYIGCCPESCATANLVLGTNGELVCETKMDLLESSGIQFDTMLPRIVCDYAGRRNAAICSSMAKIRQGSANAIKANLRWQAWERCHLQMICSELAQLQKRYKITIEHRNDHHEILVEFNRPGSSRGLGLCCRFEIDNAYPYGRMNSQIEQPQESGQPELVDLHTLQATVKNSKPGYGSLSRTINVISAFFHNATVGFGVLE